MSLGKTILVPLTNSLYVPGKLSNPEHVIVDVGTGYYVEKVSHPDLRLLYRPLTAGHIGQTRAGALTHYTGKINYIRTNLEALEETIKKKRDNVGVLIDILGAKLQQAQTPAKT